MDCTWGELDDIPPIECQRAASQHEIREDTDVRMHHYTRFGEEFVIYEASVIDALDRAEDVVYAAIRMFRFR